MAAMRHMLGLEVEVEVKVEVKVEVEIEVEICISLSLFVGGALCHPELAKDLTKTG